MVGGSIRKNGEIDKTLPKKLIGRVHFSLDELTTALAEIEAVLNSRPLSYVPDEDMEEPITPSHLIVGRRILNLPDNLDYVCDLSDSEFTLDTNHATKRVKHLNHVLNHFWKRWRTEYLSSLREVHAHISRRSPGDSNSQISVGEIVIVKDEHLPRGLWKLGIVQEVLKGRDGLTRAAVVKIASRDRQHTILKRPIQLLYPLEIHCETTTTTPPRRPLDPKPREPLPAQDDVTERVRPKRAAAKKADEVRREWIAELEKGD